MSEIRDIKPAEPMWQKRSVDKTSQDTRKELPGKKQKRKRRDGDREDDTRGGAVDEYV